MKSAVILYPCFALFFLTFGVLLHLGRSRVAAVGAREVRLDFYKDYRGDGQPEPLVVIGRHFQNLFEMPVIFYALCLIAYASAQSGPLLVGLAWLYVALRFAHTAVHLGANVVRTRFKIYVTSFCVLVAMASVVLIQLLRAG